MRMPIPPAMKEDERKEKNTTSMSIDEEDSIPTSADTSIGASASISGSTVSEGGIVVALANASNVIINVGSQSSLAPQVSRVTDPSASATQEISSQTMGSETLKLLELSGKKVGTIGAKLDISEQVNALILQHCERVLADEETTKELMLYIASRGKHRSEDEKTFDLQEEFINFLKADAKVLLLLGSSGAGKTLFARRLEREYCKAYKPDHLIPFYIPLASVDNPKKNLIEQVLQQKGFLPEHITYAKKNCRFIFFIDGFDEIRGAENLIVTNHLTEWTAKILVSCRTEYLLQCQRDYRTLFAPHSHERLQFAALREYTLAPFTKAQINTYLEKYVATTDNPPWPASRYAIYLNKFPHLQTLVESPYILFIMASALPEIVVRYADANIQAFAKLTRAALYDTFMEKWFERQIGKITVQSRLKLLGRDPLAALKSYTQSLAVAMWKAGISVVEYKPDEVETPTPFSHHLNPLNIVKTVRDKFKRLAGYQPSWDDFFKEDPRTLTLRLASPIIKEGERRYRFIHDSLREYLASKDQFDEISSRLKLLRPMPLAQPSVILEQKAKSASVQAIEVLPEVKAIVTKPEVKVTVDESVPLTQQRFFEGNIALNVKLLNDSSPMISFHADLVNDHPDYALNLWNLLKSSKQKSEIAIAAANAMTILSAAEASFVQHKDLCGVQIPDAICSWVYDSVDFSEADLTRVNFAGAWLRGVKFDKAKMQGVQFGELPSLLLKDFIYACAFSFDGKWFATGGGNDIAMYDTSSWERIAELKGHNTVTCLAFVPSDSKCLVSGGDDFAIRVWKVGNGTHRALTGHVGEIECLTHDPHTPNRLASGSSDNTVRVWDLSSGNTLQTLTGHNRMIKCLAYVPHVANRLASGSSDCTVRVWDLGSGNTLQILTGHTGAVTCLAFNRDTPDILTSGSEDYTIRVWSIATSRTLQSLEGHTDEVSSLAFDPYTSHRLVSSGSDNTVRIWTLDSPHPLQTLIGHNDWVKCLAFSPCSKSNLLASGSNDRTVRLWNMGYAPRQNLRGHTNLVTCLAFDPYDPVCLVSGSMDGTVRMWNVSSAHPCQTIIKDMGLVKCLAFDPHTSGHLALASDKTVQLCDLRSRHIFQTLECKESVRCLAFDPGKSDYLVSHGGDGTLVQSRKISSAHIHQTLEVCRDMNSIECLAFDPHNTDRLALASSSIFDQAVRMLGVRNGRTVRTLTEHTDGVTCLAFDPYPHTPNRLASGGRDKTVRVWEEGRDNSSLIVINFPQSVSAIAWGQSVFAVAAGQTIYCFAVIRTEDILSFEFRWLVGPPILWLDGVSIKGVKGLEPLNYKLLTQRGAIDGAPVEIKSVDTVLAHASGARDLPLPRGIATNATRFGLLAAPTDLIPQTHVAEATPDAIPKKELIQ